MSLVVGVDPRSGEAVGSGVAQTSSAELEELLLRADATALAFGRTPPEVRTALLLELADRLDARIDPLVALAVRETGLAEQRLVGEICRTSGQLRLFSEIVQEGSYLEVAIDSAAPSAAPPRPRLVRGAVPLGTVLVFAASNFPFAFGVLGGDTASALAVGAPVLVKAHSSHPALSVAVASLVADAVASVGLPPSVFGLVIGESAGREALLHRTVRACGFTGSTTGGSALFALATGRPDPIPFFGELGSVNPVVVTKAADDARSAAIASGFVASMTGSNGQLCTKPGLLFVPHGAATTSAVRQLVATSRPGTMLNERMRDRASSDLTELGDHLQVQLLACARSAASDEGFWIRPTVFRTTAKAVIEDPLILAAEHFGPIALIVEYDGARELIAALARVEGSLTGTVHAEPGEDVTDLFTTLTARCGRIIWNGWPTGVTVGWAMHHGGPWPATTNAGYTSVGAAAVRRWLRPVCFQDVPEELLPPELRAASIARPRRIDGILTATDSTHQHRRQSDPGPQ